MTYWFADLGNLGEGKTVEVSISDSANIRIMDAENFQKFKKNQIHEFIGGYVKFTPYTMKLPRAAHWLVVVDIGEHEHKIEAKASVYQRERKVKIERFL